MHQRFVNTGSDTAFEALRSAFSALVCACLARCAFATGILILSAWGAGTSFAQSSTASTGGIYACVDERGRRLTSDRPIPECNARDQRLLNHDGSLKSVRPPTLTPEERLQAEARERELAQARAAREEAVRRDRQLMQRFRNEQQHQRARQAALEPLRAAQRMTDSRLAELARERRPLDAEAEFHRGKPLPVKLRALVDANEAAQAAQRDAAAGQRDEADRINRRFDAELQRLRRLWNGAAPGSLGPLESVPTAP